MIQSVVSQMEKEGKRLEGELRRITAALAALGKVYMQGSKAGAGAATRKRGQFRRLDGRELQPRRRHAGHGCEQRRDKHSRSAVLIAAEKQTHGRSSRRTLETRRVIWRCRGPITLTLL